MNDKMVDNIVVGVQNAISLANVDKKTITTEYLEQKTDSYIGYMCDSSMQITGDERQRVVETLVRRYAVWSGQDSIISSERPDSWVTVDKKKDWQYWKRYKQYLLKTMSISAIEQLDVSTDGTLDLLGNPETDGLWDRRGLIVGHVQSGKTSNYIGLICKAADAGYKFIVVLAGLHNNLRAQTQIRLEEGFLGVNTEYKKYVGVGELNQDTSIQPQYGTTRSEEGDFKKKYVSNFGVNPERKPWLFVVKKNVSVLKALNDWISKRVPKEGVSDQPREIVRGYPILVIDDEADNASVDTESNVVDEYDNPNEEHEPTAINRQIRKLLYQFGQAAYVGYTATPFANIFIHHKGKTKEEGPDLFPFAFISNTATPLNYIGPAKFFGRENNSETETGESDPFPLTRLIPTDDENWISPGHKKDFIPESVDGQTIPVSLKRAILSFVLSCAVRKARGDENKHCSMLIHVTRFTQVQKNVKNQVEEYFERIYNRIVRHINEAEEWKEFIDIWKNDYVRTTNTMLQSMDKEHNLWGIEALPSWERIKSIIPDILEEIKPNIKCINGTSKDIIEYEEKKNIGLKTIVIGGDKLSRGLTLEGLSVSYFMRASNMYDTLMQMGRWFGYRERYLDLCRLYLTEELKDNFTAITDANDELREEFEIAVQRNMAPEEYGMKVKTHPGMLITSRLKMRSAQEQLISYSGHISETVRFVRANSDDNRQSMDNLIQALKDLDEKTTAVIHPQYTSDSHTRKYAASYLWKDVPSKLIIQFFNDYKTSSESHIVDSSKIAAFIEKMNDLKELEQWNVALIGGGKREKKEVITITNECKIYPIERTFQENSSDSPEFSIKRLISNRDETIDIDANDWESALELSIEAFKRDPGRAKKEPTEPHGTIIRRIRGLGYPDRVPPIEPKKALLLLYLVCPTGGKDEEPTSAFAVSFPYSLQNSVSVPYWCNTVWQKENSDAQ